MSKPTFRTQTPPRPIMSSTGDYAPRPVLLIDGKLREVGPYEMAAIRRREVLERDLNDAMRRRALHLRTGNMAAYHKANEQADRYLDLIAQGISLGRWEK